jgi:glycosyltransferase involved in cell wall biosynthesis
MSRSGLDVSVIIPAKNAEATVAAAVRSALEQTHPPFEVIVIDDGSSDRTVDVTLSIGDPRVRVIQPTNASGVSAARNAGLEAVRSRYVALLDADDVCLPDRLGRQLYRLDSDPSLAVVGAGMITFCDEPSVPQRRSGEYRSNAVVRARQVFRHSLVGASLVFDLETLGRFDIGPRLYDETLAFAEDHELCARLTRDPRIGFEQLGELLYCYRVRAAPVPGRAEATRTAVQKVRRGHFAALLPGLGEEELDILLTAWDRRQALLGSTELATLAELLLALRGTPTVSVDGGSEDADRIFAQFWRAALDRSLRTPLQAARLGPHARRAPWLASGLARWTARAGVGLFRRSRV